MGMNTVAVNSSKVSTLGTLVGASSTAGFLVPAAVIGIIVNETAGTADINIEVSNDKTLWLAHPLGAADSIIVDTAIVLEVPFKYIRATNVSTGTAIIQMSW